jgi:hypothetical protein
MGRGNCQNLKAESACGEGCLSGVVTSEERLSQVLEYGKARINNLTGTSF